MTLTNPKPLGWAYGELLTSAQMNSIASQLPNAIDGIGGGAYVLTNPLELTGDTVTIEDLVADDLAVNNDAAVSGNLAVDGYASFQLNNTTVNDANETLFDGYQGTPVRYYTGANVRTTTLSAGMSTYGWFMFRNAQTANRIIFDTDAGSNLIVLLQGQWAFIAKVGSDWRVIMAGAAYGNIPKNYYAGAATATIDPNATNYAQMSPAAAIQLNIAPGTYVYGQYVTVRNRAVSPGNTVAVRDPGGATIVTIPGGDTWADVIYDGTNWVLGINRL